MAIIINNGSEAEVVTRATESIEFIGKNGKDGRNGLNGNDLDPDLYPKWDNLGDLAFEDLIEWAKLGNTIIQGGYIRTVLIDVNAIRISGNFQTVNGSYEQAVLIATQKSNEAIENFRNGLGQLAFDDLIQFARLGETIIIGGYIRTTLIDAEALRIRGGYASSADVLAAHQAANEAAQNSGAANAAVAALRNSLGPIAFAEAIGAAMLDDTIIIGGYIKTTLLDINTIRVQGGLATENYAQERADAAALALKNTLGSLAYNNLVGQAMLDETIIVGGYINTSLINVNSIIATGTPQITAIASAEATSKVNAFSNTLGALAYANAVEKAMLGSTIIIGGYIDTSLINANAIIISGTPEISSIADARADAKVNAFKTTLGSVAYANAVSKAMLDSTLIVGGFIETTLINADTIIAKHLAAVDGTIAGFSIIGSTLRGTASGTTLTLEAGNNPMVIITSGAKSTVMNFQGLNTHYGVMKSLVVGPASAAANSEAALFLNQDYIYSRIAWDGSTGNATYGGRVGDYGADENVFYTRTDSGPKLVVYTLRGGRITGDIVEYYTLTNLSDIRYKTNVKELGYGLKELVKLKPIHYSYKDKEGKHLGFSAQDVLEVMPELVDKDNPERLTLSIIELIPVMVNAIKELNNKINDEVRPKTN